MNKLNKIEPPGIGMMMKGSYKLQVVDAKTDEVVEDRPWCNNLILNCGMNYLVNDSVASMNSFGIAGSGSRPNRFDSGISAITQSGANVYLYDNSGDITDFTAVTSSYPRVVQYGDVLAYANGSRSIVTALIDARNITVSPTYSIDLANSQSFTVWKTSQPGLEKEIRRGGPGITDSSYLVGSSSLLGWNCGSQISCSTIVNRRTYNFAEEVLGYTYTEVGVSWTRTRTDNGNSSSFARALVEPPLTVAAGFRLRMTHDLKVTYTPWEPRNFTASISGWPTSGSLLCTESIQRFPSCASTVDTNGSSGGETTIEPVSRFTTNHGNTGGGPLSYVNNDSTPLANFSSSAGRVGSQGVSSWIDDVGYQYPTYVTNSFEFYKQTFYTVTNAVSTNIRSLGFGNFYGGGFGSPVYPWTWVGLCLVFDYPQTKTSLQKMYLSWRHSWQRDLS